MSAALLTAVAAIGILTCLNLVLTWGVIRRLREQGDELSLLAEGSGEQEFGGALVGQALPEFAAVTVDGLATSHRDLIASPSFAGFFTTSCPPCRERLPEFARYVKAVGLDKQRVLVVVGGTRPAAEEMIAEIREVANVVVEDEVEATLSTAFGVAVFPTMIALRDGVVEAGGPTVGRLPSPAAQVSR